MFYIQQKCLQAPSNLTSSMGWASNQPSFTSCSSSSSLQCFQIEGDLASSARIMYKGLCLGIDPSDTRMPVGGSYTPMPNLRPCDEGYTSWWRTTEGYIKFPGCTFDNVTGNCAYALYGNYQQSSLLTLINTRISSTIAKMFMQSWGRFLTHSKLSYPGRQD